MKYLILIIIFIGYTFAIVSQSNNLGGFMTLDETEAMPIVGKFVATPAVVAKPAVVATPKFVSKVQPMTIGKFSTFQSQFYFTTAQKEYFLRWLIFTCDVKCSGIQNNTKKRV
jgi:hypothetical protein